MVSVEGSGNHLDVHDIVKAYNVLWTQKSQVSEQGFEKKDWRPMDEANAVIVMLVGGQRVRLGWDWMFIKCSSSGLLYFDLFM